MSEELKSCPLCGAMPEKLRTGYMCSTLGCALQENTVSEKDWNTRPIEDALNNRIAELENFINQLIEAGEAVINAYPDWIREEDDWDELVKDWKEREE